MSEIGNPKLELNYILASMPEIFSLISKIERKLLQFQRLMLKETDLTPPQYAVINALQETNGVSLTELSITTFSTKSTMTTLIDNLEKKELVKRQPHPKDRRSLQVKLTEQGKNLARSAPEINSIYGECCTLLEPSELNQLSFLLKKLESSFNFLEQEELMPKRFRRNK
ncbi:MAG: MarR family winged helix-turn-helix transcriptional regulator [Candidatus Kariarchaeaceae archaeon]|jgi:DNA-binding MarR family transcriptional regulator